MSVDLDQLDKYGTNWTDLQAYGRWLGMPGCHNRASKVPSAPHAERLAALWNAYPEISKELRALREVVAAYENRDRWANSEWIEDRQAARIRLEKAIAEWKRTCP